MKTQTTSDGTSSGEPGRLVDETGDPAGAFVRAANAHASARARSLEARAWFALTARDKRDVGGRSSRRSSRRRALIAWFVPAVSCAALLVLWQVRDRRGDRSQPPSGTIEVANVSMRPAAKVSTASPAVVALLPEVPAATGVSPERSAEPSRTVAMVPAHEIVSGGLRLRLSRGGTASLLSSLPALPSLPALSSLPSRQPSAIVKPTSVSLVAGRLTVDGNRSDSASKPIEVHAAAFRVAGDSGGFDVTVSPSAGRVGVNVRRGDVAVWSSKQLLVRLSAGQHWTSPPRVAWHRVAASQEPLASEAPSAEAGRDAERERVEPDCLQLARAGSVDQAIGCFERQSAMSGLSAELAWVELARLRRDVKGDLQGAARTLEQYRSRFPHGALAREAAISRVELLLRLSRPEDALVEARSLPDGEGDFWRGVCLAKLGRPEEARGAFDGYLARPNAARRTEALKRRRELTP